MHHLPHIAFATVTVALVMASRVAAQGALAGPHGLPATRAGTDNAH